jgi:hypothetical protein
VYEANKELEALSIIRVAHSKPTIGPDGSFVRGPQIIVYLPIRQLSSEEADFERKRLQFALDAARTPEILSREWPSRSCLRRAFGSLQIGSCASTECDIRQLRFSEEGLRP